MVKNARSTNQIDIHIGRKLRLLRMEKDISQTQLANCAEISFQQIQKYEKGVNRISASRLWKICEAMNVPLTYFFDGVKGGETSVSAGFAQVHELGLGLYHAKNHRTG